jgi:hypothetical protein
MASLRPAWTMQGNPSEKPKTRKNKWKRKSFLAGMPSPDSRPAFVLGLVYWALDETIKGLSWSNEELESFLELGLSLVWVVGSFLCSLFSKNEERSLWGEWLGLGSACVFLSMFYFLFSAGPVNPKGLFLPLLLLEGPSKRSAPLRWPPAMLTKCPLLRKKPSLIGAPPGQ